MSTCAITCQVNMHDHMRCQHARSQMMSTCMITCDGNTHDHMRCPHARSYKMSTCTITCDANMHDHMRCQHARSHVIPTCAITDDVIICDQMRCHHRNLDNCCRMPQSTLKAARLDIHTLGLTTALPGFRELFWFRLCGHASSAVTCSSSHPLSLL